MAPRPAAAPMAASPATPAPITNTFAGGTLPAAVICPVKKRPKSMRRLDHGAIAGDVGHRRERVHLLRARHARHAVHREHGGLARREALHEVGVLRRPDEGDETLPFAEHAALPRRSGARTLKTMSAVRPHGGAHRERSWRPRRGTRRRDRLAASPAPDCDDHARSPASRASARPRGRWRRASRRGILPWERRLLVPSSSSRRGCFSGRPGHRGGFYGYSSRTKPRTSGASPIPFHPGAARYLKERGIAVKQAQTPVSGGRKYSVSR